MENPPPAGTPSHRSQEPHHPIPSPFDLPAWTLVQTAHLAGRRFHDIFASQGLTAHQFGVLVQLARQPGLSQAALARAILVTPQSIGDIVVQMQDEGFVTRTPPSQRGGAVAVNITALGRASLEATYPLVGALNEPAALGLDETQASTLNKLLHLVHNHLDDRPFRPLPHGV